MQIYCVLSVLLASTCCDYFRFHFSVSYGGCKSC